MKRTWLAILATIGLFNAPALAQVDLGGTISGAINQATGGAQAGANTGANLGGTGSNLGTQGSIETSGGASTLPGPNFNATGQAAAGVTGAQSTNQSWLGRVGNDLRNAVRQGSDGAMQLQNDINQSLQQYGFQPGDQLLNASGQPLTQAQFDQYLQQNNSQVRVLRNGQTVVLNGNANLGAGQFDAQGQIGADGQLNQGQWNQGQLAPSQQTGGPFYGQAARPRLGVTMRPGNDGVHVIGVVVGSPAAQAGIKPGDQIIAVNGQGVNNPGQMIEVISSLPSQEQLNIQYVRHGRQMEAQAILASQSPQMSGAYRAGYPNWDESQQGFNGASESSSGSLEQRLATLEQTVSQLRQQVRELGGQPIDEDAGVSDSTTLQNEVQQSQDVQNQDRQGQGNQSGEPATAPDSPSSESDDPQDSQ